MKTLSTTKLSQELGISTKEMFEILVNHDLIFRNETSWKLTIKGKQLGGEVIKTDKFPEFIAWPETLKDWLNSDSKNSKHINATRIGETFELSNQRINNILHEIGWIEKATKGWQITNLGKKIGGLQKSHPSGGSYVTWPNSILTNPIFIKSINPQEDVHTFQSNDIKDEITSQRNENKIPAELYKSKDGHLVRSRGELLIDNFLYEYSVRHAYERELTVNENVQCDFYIPSSKNTKSVYIEFWGVENNENYTKRKTKKIEIYKSNGLNLIEIKPFHINNLDSFLRRELLKYGINVDKLEH